MPNRKIAPELLDYSQWPGVNVLLLSESEAIRFNRLEAAVKAACDGVKSAEINRQFGIKRSLLHYYLVKCTSEHSDGRAKGFRALVPETKRDGYVRSLEPLPGIDGSGLAGAFTYLLNQYPSVKDWLIHRLKPDDGTKIQSAGLNSSAIHQEFLTKLRKAGHCPDQYPFTTSRHGYEALCAYIKKRINGGDDHAARSKFGDQATEGLSRNSGKIAIFRPLVAYERTAYDEYQFPDISTITIEIADEEIEVPLKRGYFCPIVDFKTTAILGYSWSIANRFRTLDFLQAFEFAIHPPPCIEHEAFIDLAQLPDEGFPAAVIPAANGRRVCSLCVDNHLTHLANAVVTDFRKRTGVTISYGKVHSWIERNVVEGIFAEFQNALKRISSTTGSGPNDPVVRDPVEKAVRYKIRAADIKALLDKLVTRHNARRMHALMMATPNEAIAADWAESSRLQIVPRYPTCFVSNPCIAVEVEWPTVRGIRAKGRTPYIQLDEVQYTNDILRQSWSLVGQKLMVQIRGDYRTVHAFRADGTEFGILHVSGVWALSPHTRETRKEINRLYRNGVFIDRSLDPVAHYQRYLAGIVLKKTRGKKHPKITREAGKLARTMDVPGSVNDPAEYRYVYKASSPPEPTTVKPRGRRAFFSPSPR
ncbi:hypothetical protein [Comamonas thiooxydans]|uniref:hypothetical protein n=1 Tax=Comamonas thiooxydans TaxID=363952 RepID=UPI0005F87942|nr:hypothetical protein [Comamonas thiooxydans]CUB01365.1 hypothetical protein Ga0061062_11371 [Comamonas thiooxydans]